MNAPHRPESDCNVDVIANDWLDDVLSSPIPADLTRQQYERLADFRLLDSMLLHLLREAKPADLLNSSAESTESPPSAVKTSVPALVLFSSPGRDAVRWAFEGMPFAYLVATMVVGVGLLIASLVHVAVPDSNASSTPSLVKHSLPLQDRQPQLQFVGRVTGMVDCRWADPETEAILGAHVPLSRRYALTSGLLEITYDSGAKLLLQGPVTYEIDSPAGGFLTVGRLTARLEKRGEEREEKGERANGLASPLSPLPSPLFAVRTPTATVTDLGTEFGVEVSQDGQTTSYVFRGSVAVRALSGNGKPRDECQVLRERESAVVRAGQEKIAVRGDVAAPSTFVRRLPRWTRINAFNTGVDAAEGQPDRHWQIVAVSNDPTFKPRPAVVTSAIEEVWAQNLPGTSQWISLVGDGSGVPGGVVYTFRTAFHLKGARLETATLRGRFMVDNSIYAIRLNGHEVLVTERSHPMPSHTYLPFTATRGFVEGENVLEIDVLNAVNRVPYGIDNPMGLRVLLEGRAVQSDE